MDPSIVKKHALNCFLLTLPIMIWNVLLTRKLPKAFQPEVFWSDIPAFLTYGENSSRILLFMLTVLMPIKITTVTQKKGLILYACGTILYFATWLALIFSPDSRWSTSVWGFMAPAFTPLLWLAGIGLVGDSFYFNLPYRRWLFLSTALVFLSFHNLHTMTIFCRTHGAISCSRHSSSK